MRVDQDTNTDSIHQSGPRRKTLNEMIRMIQNQTDEERERKLQDYYAKLEGLQKSLIQSKFERLNDDQLKRPGIVSAINRI